MSRGYGQFCGLAHALEVVGGRWTLLIVRDLLGGPRRFTESQQGLPGIPTNVLSGRLRDLEEAGVTTRQLLPKGVAYTLTEHGRALENALVPLGLWGARTMGPPGDGDFFSVHSLSLALRGAFHPDKARPRDREYELRLGDQTLTVSLADGTVSFPPERGQHPDVVIETDPATMSELLAGRLDLDHARAADLVRLTGPVTSARRFFDIFQLSGPVGPPAPG